MRFVLGLALVSGALACSSQPIAPAPPAGSAIIRFAFSASGDTMDVLVYDSATIALAEHRVATGVGPRMPAGPIVRGSGVDAGFPFHYLPGEVRLVDLAMEICDGRPMLTPEAVDDFIEGVTGNRNADQAQWCPWGARPTAVERIDQTGLSPRATTNAPGIR
ncbi:MAG: BP74-related protein [Gemmatimonadales bacterium]